MRMMKSVDVCLTWAFSFVHSARELSLLVKYHSSQYLDCSRVHLIISRGITNRWEQHPKEVEKLEEAEVSKVCKFFFLVRHIRCV